MVGPYPTPRRAQTVRPPTGQTTPVRVDRSFAFVDLCGFTSYTATQGDAQATGVLAGFRAALREIGSRRGVRVAKWLGDGAMLVGVDPEPLVSAVLEVEHRIDERDSRLPIRAGLVRGPVILFEGDDYIGTPVNLAARLCDAAGPRQVLASPSFCAVIPPWVGAGDTYQVELPGFRDAVEVVRLFRRPAGAEPVTDPVCGLILDRAMAVAAEAPDGERAWFCSESCAMSWSGLEAIVEP
jgi:adenylate cyclase